MLEFLESGKALSVFIAICAIGIVSKFITRSLYKRLIKETDNMAMTKNKNLKVLKQKLENAYRLNQNIVNTQAYLDKQLYTFKFMGATLSWWNNLSMQMTILGLLAGGAASFAAYWFRLDSYYIILYASAGALGSLLLTFLDSSFNMSLKQQRLSNALLEYVDNSVFVRVVRENAGREREAGREFAAVSRETGSVTRKMESGMRAVDSSARVIETQDAAKDRESLIRENELRDGLVREESLRENAPKRGRQNGRNRNTKAEELLRTVRNLKSETEDEEGARSETLNPNSEVRRDIDYLKHSLEQIAASKEKPRSSDDWTKNLDTEELKVIGEIMRQYFSGK